MSEVQTTQSEGPNDAIPNEAISVVSAVRPQLLRELLTRCLRKTGIKVLAEVDSGPALLRLVRRTDVGVAIIPLSVDEELPKLVDQLLTEKPELVVIGLSRDGNVGFAWHRQIQRVRLEEIDVPSLASVCRRDLLAV